MLHQTKLENTPNIEYNNDIEVSLKQKHFQL